MRKAFKKRGTDDMTGLLFDPVEMQPAPPVLSERLRAVKWSYSRRNILEQCPRQYYYRYYGAARGAALEEADKPLLQQLKGLQNRHQRAGKHLHLVIATSLRKAQSGEEWTTERLVDWGRALWQADVEYSRCDPTGDNSIAGQFPPALLQEFYYGLPNAEMLCEAAELKLTRALEQFGTSEEFAWLRTLGAQSGAQIERHFTLDGFPCNVKGVIDLLHIENQSAAIADWKIGDASAEGDDSLQLAVYALWVRESCGCETDDIALFKAFLGSGDVVPFRVDEDVLTAARGRIIQDAERMAFVHSYGERGAVEAFTACAQPAVCANCPYLRACPEGKECCDDGFDY